MYNEQPKINKLSENLEKDQIISSIQKLAETFVEYEDKDIEKDDKTIKLKDGTYVNLLVKSDLEEKLNQIPENFDFTKIQEIINEPRDDIYTIINKLMRILELLHKEEIQEKRREIFSGLISDITENLTQTTNTISPLKEEIKEILQNIPSDFDFTNIEGKIKSSKDKGLPEKIKILKEIIELLKKGQPQKNKNGEWKKSAIKTFSSILAFLQISLPADLNKIENNHTKEKPQQNGISKDHKTEKDTSEWDPEEAWHDNDDNNPETTQKGEGPWYPLYRQLVDVFNPQEYKINCLVNDILWQLGYTKTADGKILEEYHKKFPKTGENITISNYDFLDDETVNVSIETPENITVVVSIEPEKHRRPLN